MEEVNMASTAIATLSMAEPEFDNSLELATTTATVSVLLVAEGTYPYHFGGVSTWCHGLIECMPDVSFNLFTITDNPRAQKKFSLPPNVVSHENRAVWGGRFATEGDRRARTKLSLSTPTREAIESDFIPAYEEFLEQIFGATFDPKLCAKAIHEMHRHFVTHGFDATMRSENVWECNLVYLTRLLEDLGPVFGFGETLPTMGEVTQLTMWLRHWLQVIAGPIPATTIVHTAMAGLCTLVAIVAKREHGARFVSTEHGVYLREVYLAESKVPTDLLKLVRIQWARRLTELGYSLADQISPCCDYNQRWELRNGADPGKLRTIYYGLDLGAYTPPMADKRCGLSVVWVGRINPLKDLETLLRAAATVCNERSDVIFNLFGSASEEDLGYEAACHSLWRQLGLQDRVIFRGYTDRPLDAFSSADIVVLPSISEGFPNSTLEAMLCARPVVVTSVGGLPEQIAGVGIAVQPRNPLQLAHAISALLEDAEMRLHLGIESHRIASTRFTIERLRREHMTTYERLLMGLGPESCAGDRFDHSSVRVITRPDATTNSGFSHSIVIDPNAAKNGMSIESEEVVPAISLTEIASEIARHQGEPIDALEVTALLETLGYNDRRAAKQFGVRDVFDLGEQVFEELNRRNFGRHWWIRRNSPKLFLASMLVRRGPVRNLPGADRHNHEMRGDPTLVRRRWRGLGTLGAAAVVLLLIHLSSLSAHWTKPQMLGVYVGAAFGSSIANGFVMAVCRPLSFYLASRKQTNVLVVLRQLAAWWCVVVPALMFGLIVVEAAFARPSWTEMALTGCGSLATALMWSVLGVGLILGVSATRLAGFTVFFATATVLIDRGLVYLTSFHFPVSVVLGFTFAIGAGVALVRHTLKDRLKEGLTDGMTPVAAEKKLFAWAPTLQDAFPYFLAGVLSSLILLVPHVFAWTNVSTETNWESSRTQLEMGLTLGLLPFIASIGSANVALQKFWKALPLILNITPARRFTEVGERLENVVHEDRISYTKGLFAWSVVELIVLSVLVLSGQVHIGSGTSSWWFLTALLGGLSSGLFFGIATFNAMFSLSLGMPKQVVVALGTSMFLSVVMFGWPLAIIWSPRAALVSVVIAAASYAVLSTNTCRFALKRSAQFSTIVS
jgi:polysaccharide biosynthesis protein PelF